MAHMMCTSSLRHLKLDPYQLYDVMRNSYHSLHLPNLFSLSIANPEPHRNREGDRLQLVASTVSAFLSNHSTVTHVHWDWEDGNRDVGLRLSPDSLPQLLSLDIHGLGAEGFFRDTVELLCLRFTSRDEAVVATALHAAQRCKHASLLKLGLAFYDDDLVKALRGFRRLTMLDLDIHFRGSSMVGPSHVHR